MCVYNSTVAYKDNQMVPYSVGPAGFSACILQALSPKLKQVSDQRPLFPELAEVLHQETRALRVLHARFAV